MALENLISDDTQADDATLYADDGQYDEMPQTAPKGALSSLSSKAEENYPVRQDVLSKRAALQGAIQRLAQERLQNSPYNQQAAHMAFNNVLGSGSFNPLSDANAAYQSALENNFKNRLAGLSDLERGAKIATGFDDEDLKNYQNLQKEASTQEVQQYALGSKKRADQAAMLSGILNETNPEKQQALINQIVPAANQLNPAYQIPADADVSTIRALVQGQISPEKQAELQQQLRTQMGGFGPDAGGGIFPTPSPSGDLSGISPSAGANSGEQYLATLPPSIASQVKAIAEGKMPLPGAFALKTPYWQNMLKAVTAYDPSFDAVNYNARASTRKDFTSGKMADNISALNTAMSHLQSLSDSYDQLGNSPSETYNQFSNYLGKAVGNEKIQSNMAKVSTNAEAVAHELAKVFRSSGMSEAEIRAWKDKINTNSTPAETKAVIESAIELMNGRLDALAERYNQGMGTTKNGLELLTPKAQAAYEKLTGGTSSAATPNGLPAGAKKAPDGTLVSPKSKEEYDALPSGTKFVDPLGKQRTKP